ncbi:MAG: peptide chain release factor N(5)-glutamine methyltransferase [Lachnospiraceae bacterium]|nr:peptide chain release factor N(5)-glutamine methyltransferase [Lachnospiraceae bacterium]
MASIQELLQYGKEQLEQSGNEYAKYERKVLLEEVLGCNYMYMLMNGEEEVHPEKEEEYKAKLSRRLEHYPLQYLLGYAHFMDYTFLVNEDVLIPRNDTEILVECADEIIKRETAAGTEAERLPGEKYRVIDLCCGTGCIGISLKLYHGAIELVLTDISEKALDVAKRNLEKYNLEAELICGDLFCGISHKADMIISNPPYIESRVIGTLMPEVREYEPMMALDGGETGLDFYEKITAQAPDHLRTGGWLLFEIGYNQNEAVQKLMRECGFKDVVGKKDYSGLDRVVMGHL